MTDDTVTGDKSVSLGEDFDRIADAMGSDETNVIKIEADASSQWDFYREHLYEHDKTWIREILTNHISACEKAERKFGITPKITINLVVENTADGVCIKLVTRDNGVGVTDKVLNNRMTQLGEIELDSDGTLNGKWGVGIVRYYWGVDDMFMMHTNPRETNEGPKSGYFVKGNFVEHTSKRKFSGDEYGTEFEFIVREGFSAEEIDDWITYYSKFSKVPVEYNLEIDGVVEKEKVFDNSELTSYFDNENLVYTFSNKYVEIAGSILGYDRFSKDGDEEFDASNQVLHINYPMNCQKTINIEHLSQPVIRINDENGVVAFGPNKGKIPVENGGGNNFYEYSTIEQKNLSKKDCPVPEITVSRDSFKRDDCYERFFEKVKEKAHEAAKKKVIEFIQTADMLSEDETFFDLSTENQEAILKLCDHAEQFTRKCLSECKRNDSLAVSEQTLNIFNTLMNETYFIKFIRMNGENGFTKVTDIQWKERFASQVLNSGVYTLTSSDDYDVFETHFGYEPLKTIRKSDLTDKYNISPDEVYEKCGVLLSSQKRPIDTQITIHSGNTTEKMKCGEMIAHYLSVNSDSQEFTEFTHSKLGEKLLTFSPSAEENLSDNRDIPSHNVSDIANCPQEVVELIKSNDFVYTSIESLQEDIGETTLFTSKGKINRRELTEYEKTRFVKVPRNETINFNDNDVNVYKFFRNKEVLCNVKKTFNDEQDSIIVLVTTDSEILRCNWHNYVKSETHSNLENMFSRAWLGSKYNNVPSVVMNKLKGFDMSEKRIQFLSELLRNNVSSTLDSTTRVETTEGQVPVEELDLTNDIILVSFKEQTLERVRREGLLQYIKPSILNNIYEFSTFDCNNTTVIVSFTSGIRKDIKDECTGDVRRIKSYSSRYADSDIVTGYIYAASKLYKHGSERMLKYVKTDSKMTDDHIEYIDVLLRMNR